MRNLEAREPGALPGDLWGNDTTKARQSQMAEPKSQARWNAENTVCVNLRINRNQDPELYAILTKSQNIGQTVRELLRKAIADQK